MPNKSVTERHARFLDFGFYPPELPPCFSTKGWGRKAQLLVEEIKALPEVKGKPAYRRFISEKTTFYFPRFNNTDRIHSVINPISYLFISEKISEKYDDLKRIESISKYSLTTSAIDNGGSRAIRRPFFDKRDEFISQLSTRFEYTVSTDIRAFYHSIYSHSIPWAIHGKEFAKKNRNLNFYGNELDLLVRNAQGGANHWTSSRTRYFENIS